MADQKQDTHSEEPVHLEPQPVQPEPVPVSSEPVPIKLDEEVVSKPVQPPPEELEPLTLVESEDDGGPSKIHATGAGSRISDQKEDFARPMNVTGQGATRCRVFHARIADAPLPYRRDEDDR